MKNKTPLISWTLRIGIAGLFVMAAVPKLTAQTEPVELFAALGGAPAMYLTGILEAIAAVVLLVPKTKIYGVVLALGLMGGAIVSHLAVLDNDEMLPLAIILFVAASVLSYLHRSELPLIGQQAPSTQPAEPA